MAPIQSNYSTYLYNKNNFQYVYNTEKLNTLIEKTEKAFADAMREYGQYVKMKNERHGSIEECVAFRNYVKADTLLEKCAEKYNNFLLRQDNAQKAFEKLNPPQK